MLCMPIHNEFKSVISRFTVKIKTSTYNFIIANI